MSARALVSLADGSVELEFWLLAAAEEAGELRVARCQECPLRAGGEWRAGLDAALEDATPAEARRLRRWGCHNARARCGGMLDAVAILGDQR